MPWSLDSFICAQTSNAPRPTFRRFPASTSAPRASAVLTKGPSCPFLLIFLINILAFYLTPFIFLFFCRKISWVSHLHPFVLKYQMINFSLCLGKFIVGIQPVRSPDAPSCYLPAPRAHLHLLPPAPLPLLWRIQAVQRRTLPRLPRPTPPSFPLGFREECPFLSCLWSFGRITLLNEPSMYFFCSVLSKFKYFFCSVFVFLSPIYLLTLLSWTYLPTRPIFSHAHCDQGYFLHANFPPSGASLHIRTFPSGVLPRFFWWF